MTERAVRARVEPHPSRHSQAKDHLSASVAQLVEQRTENPRVVGSIPTGGTISADLAHLVERHLAKVEVAGSSPVIRSKKKALTRSAFLFFVCIGALHPPRTLRVLRLLSGTFVCRRLSPAPARLCRLALGALRFAKTVINCFPLAHPVTAPKTKTSPLAGFCYP